LQSEIESYQEKLIEADVQHESLEVGYNDELADVKSHYDKNILESDKLMEEKDNNIIDLQRKMKEEMAENEKNSALLNQKLDF